MPNCELCKNRPSIFHRYKQQVCVICSQLITDAHKLYFQIRGKKGLKRAQMNLSEKLKLYGKTQQEFATDVGVGVNTVNRWLNSRVKKISRLARQRIEEVLNRYETERQTKGDNDEAKLPHAS